MRRHELINLNFLLKRKQYLGDGAQFAKPDVLKCGVYWILTYASAAIRESRG
jgi:hypothetical protein